MTRIPRSHFLLLGGVVAVILWSGWRPYDRLTWWLEASPGMAGVLILVATYQRFRFTTLCYTLIALHICVLCVGGHYTYARVPLFDWLDPKPIAYQPTGTIIDFQDGKYLDRSPGSR